ncbi:MAG: squalene/phytoene synthase family protein [Methylophilaceae bacterium]|nr:squalene/phytoene synthase family protein [Methylophilaceae bacterium]
MSHSFLHINTQQTANSEPAVFPDKLLHLASWLLPFRLREPATLIYKFAMQAYAISIADNFSPEQRLQLLHEFKQAMDKPVPKAPVQPDNFASLHGMIKTQQLPLAPFYDLLDANCERITKNRYENFGEIMSFSRRSANPLGRLALHLLDAATPRNIGYSDALCSALQIIKFLQNVAIAAKKGYIYFPQTEMRKYNITDEQIFSADISGIWPMFFEFEVKRARRLLQSAAPLGLQIKGLAGMEVRMLIAGGERILQKLHQSRGDVLQKRPVLTPIDWVYMIYRAIRAK